MKMKNPNCAQQRKKKKNAVQLAVRSILTLAAVQTKRKENNLGLCIKKKKKKIGEIEGT